MTPDEALRHMELLRKLVKVDDWDEELCPIITAYVLHAFGESDPYDSGSWERAVAYIKDKLGIDA